MSNVSLIDGHIDKMTNYERIKNMSVDEMAVCFSKFSQCDNCLAEDFCNKINNRDDDSVMMSCEQRLKEWIESESETE